MANIIIKETNEIIKTFETEEKALAWIECNCSVTLAWLMGAKEGSAYFKGEEIDLVK